VYVLQDQVEPPLQPQKDFAILLTASTQTNPCPSKTVSNQDWQWYGRFQLHKWLCRVCGHACMQSHSSVGIKL